MKNYSNFIDFARDYSTPEACYEHLCEYKWAKGYKCRSCGHDTHVKGRKWYYRKCQKCQYDESCTAHTLFHKLKFPIVKAFWISYELSTMKKGMSTMEIARKYEIHQETAWFFKRKIQQAMSPLSDEKLKDNIEVDEFTVGGKEEGKPGRSHGKKKIVQVAIEIEYPEDDESKGPLIKCGSALVIEDYSAKELGRGVEQMVDSEAVITTDEWSAYIKALDDRWHLTFPSDQGKNFVKLHWHIFNIKNWLRGIHHKVSSNHIQGYLDEYHYRFNRRNQISSCPRRLMNRMIKKPWLPYEKAMGT